MAKKTLVIFWILVVLLSFGIIDALFLIYLHLTPDSSRFCGAGEFNCDVVNKGVYSTLDGVSYFWVIDLGLPGPIIDLGSKNMIFNVLLSNAFLGALALGIVLVFVLRLRKEKPIFGLSLHGMRRIILGILLVGIAYGAYLFYIQHSILKTYCLYCLVLDGVLVVSLGLVMAMRIRRDKP